MKHILLISIITSFLLFNACDTRDKVKVAMDKSFKEYIENNDKEKHFQTKIQHISTVAYKEIEDSGNGEVYEAKVYFVATTSLVGSRKVYNINDTITSYFDKDLRMTRKINTGEE